MIPVSFICHWDDRTILQSKLLASLTLGPCDELILRDGDATLAIGLASGERAAQHPIVVHVHQDVVMRPGWREQFDAQLALIQALDPHWGLIGVVGIDYQVDPGGAVLRINNVGSGRDLGGEWHRTAFPCRAVSLDGCLFIKRRGVPEIDQHIPGWMVGVVEDLCLSARAAGLGVWIADVETEHHSVQRNPSSEPTRGLAEEVEYLVSKWGHDIPSTYVLWEYSLALVLDIPVKQVFERLERGAGGPITRMARG